MKYTEIDKRKKAFIFELDNVLYPEKDYLFQVYYIFAGLLEYTTLAGAGTITDALVSAYLDRGKTFAFDGLKEKLGVDEKYGVKLQELMVVAKLPLKLLLFKKCAFVVTGYSSRQEAIVHRYKRRPADAAKQNKADRMARPGALFKSLFCGGKKADAGDRHYRAAVKRQ